MLCAMTYSSMPLFSRLIASWSALLILIGACVLQIGIVQLVHSDLTVGYDIQVGNFTSSKFTSNDVAAAKLSDGQNQQGWWKLANADWHDSAILRFFSQGPLGAADMENLVSLSGQSDSWLKSGISLKQIDLMQLALIQQHSTATYRMNQTIQGTGRIEASMWTLLFRCIGIDSCSEGYFVPMLPVPLSSQNQQLDKFSLHSLWLNLTHNLLVNAIPSFIAKLPRPRSVTMKNVDDPQLSIVINVYDNVNDCPPTAAALLGYRSLLDASYGLVPGLSCINFGTADQPFKLLVSLVLFFDNGTEPADINLTTLESFFSQLNVNTGKWKHLPFEECSEAGLLIRSSQDPNSLKLCYKDVCVTTDDGSGTCTRDGVQHLRFLHSISIFSNSCTFDGGKPLNASSNYTASSQFSCQMGTANSVCNATVGVNKTDLMYSINPLRLLSPQSNWSSTESHNTSEFSYAPNTADLNATRICTRSPSPLSPFFVSNTTQAAFLQRIQIKATTYLNSFIAEHNIAFMMRNGSATDFRSFLALILSTAISVILTIAGPFPNFLLRRICRIRPLHLDSQRSGVSKVVNVSFQMICNIQLSFCLFLPVLYMARSELDREIPFDTWDLGANDEFIYNSNFGSDMQLRVVYLISATSKYESHFCSASTLVACITCFIAGLCSAWRSKEVFDRYALLQKCGSIVASNGGRPVKEQLDREALLVRALKAIEMTEAEYLVLKTEYEEVQQMATKRGRPSYFSWAKIRRTLSPLTGIRRPPPSVGYTLSRLSLRRWKSKRVASFSRT